MPGIRRTKLDAFRQLIAVEKHDKPNHFAKALGARHNVDAPAVSTKSEPIPAT